MNSNPVIYIIIHNTKDISYVGSTFNYERRISNHKFNCNKNRDCLVYNVINNNGGWDNFDKFIIESCDKDITKEELKKLEQEYINILKRLMNTIKAYITLEDLTLYRKHYYNNYNKINYERMKEYRKLYYREYNKINYDKMKEYRKLYYNNNKEKWIIKKF
jgi:hypothetical protein